MNYYEHHLGDWAAATGHLSWDEDMAYTRLLRAYYHAEKAIPVGQQYRLAKASTPAQRKAVDAVVDEFFVLVDGAFHQKRADRELERYLDKQRKAKASAIARWSHTERNANASPNAMRTHSEGNALQSPDTSLQTPKSKSIARGSRLPNDFVPDAEFAAGIGIDANTEFEKFRDYWQAQPGQKGVKTDWPATWRNWCRNAKPSGKPASSFVGVI